jgi:DNA-binding transcriptional LysR family regulator
MDIKNLDLRHLRYFLVVAEELHFTRAAARLHMAQPPLSRQIKELELIVGTALFERAKKRIRLTPAGSALVQEIKPWLDDLAPRLASAAQVSSGQSGSLRIGANTATIANPLVPQLLQHWRQEHPALRLDFVELNSIDQQPALLNGRIDVGLAWDVTERWPGIRFEPIVAQPLCCYLQRRHPLARQQQIKLPQLANYPLITFPRRIGTTVFRQFLALCAREGFTPSQTVEYEDFTMIQTAVAASEGIGIMPDAFDDLMNRSIVKRPLAGARTLAIPLWLLMPERQPQPSVLSLQRLVRQLRREAKL